MSDRINPREELAVPLPIPQKARQIARQFARQQPTPQKATQVRLNTLAVCVANDLLEMLGITTDLTAGDSWNPVVRLCADVADLELPGLGRLECRPLSVDEEVCYIPSEVWSDRIGYAIVQIDELNWEAKVLGFIATVDREALDISQLQSPEDLIDRLHQLGDSVLVSQSANERINIVNLNQWLNNIFEAGWEAVETLLNPAEPDFAFNLRAADSWVTPGLEPLEISIERAKLIQLADCFVALIVQLIPESEQKLNVVLQVHPVGNEIHLPPSLQLLVLDEAGATFLDAQSRSADNHIQLEFSGQPGERFRVKIMYREVTFTGNFVI